MTPVVKESDVVRCMDCLNCLMKVPRSEKKVRCSAGIFDDIFLSHPFLIVYRCCKFSDIELDWPSPVVRLSHWPPIRKEVIC
jgi:hypothetical protein